MASTSSDVEFEADSKDEDDLFSELSREELMHAIKDLISHCHSKTKNKN